MPMIISPIISPHHPSNKLIGRYRNFIMYVHFHKKWQSIMGVSGCERLVTINVRFPHIFYMTAKLCQPEPYVKQNITVFTLARQLGLSGSLLFYYAYLN